METALAVGKFHRGRGGLDASEEGKGNRQQFEGQLELAQTRPRRGC